ncbi:MAG: hypothetical protein Q8S73_12845 [Deltaproteobacteria bacterium]|nr:hypothetical protein [Myxococcales bacterium]MDP3214988.1 hypothetical protein [Deltaproteobacteria bacterium]
MRKQWVTMNCARGARREAERPWEDTIQLRGKERVRIAFRPGAPRPLDVPLQHPRTRRQRDDGHPARGALRLASPPSTLEGLAPEHRTQADALLDAVRATALCAAVSAALAGRHGASDTPAAEAVAALVLALPDRTFEGLLPEARSGLDALRGAEALSPSLGAEVGVVRVVP